MVGQFGDFSCEDHVQLSLQHALLHRRCQSIQIQPVPHPCFSSSDAVGQLMNGCICQPTVFITALAAILQLGWETCRQFLDENAFFDWRQVFPLQILNAADLVNLLTVRRTIELEWDWLYDGSNGGPSIQPGRSTPPESKTQK